VIAPKILLDRSTAARAPLRMTTDPSLGLREIRVAVLSLALVLLARSAMMPRHLVPDTHFEAT